MAPANTCSAGRRQMIECVDAIAIMETVSAFPPRWAAVWAAVSAPPPWMAWRNLTPAEMLDQIYRIQTDERERSQVSNIVIMGSGEPPTTASRQCDPFHCA